MSVDHDHCLWQEDRWYHGQPELLQRRDLLRDCITDCIAELRHCMCRVPGEESPDFLTGTLYHSSKAVERLTKINGLLNGDGISRDTLDDWSEQLRSFQELLSQRWEFLSFVWDARRYIRELESGSAQARSEKSAWVFALEERAIDSKTDAGDLPYILELCRTIVDEDMIRETRRLESELHGMQNPRLHHPRDSAMIRSYDRFTDLDLHRPRTE